MKQTKQFLIICSLIMVTLPNIYGQVKETLYYDTDWKGVGTIEEAEFYRVVTFSATGQPTGEILDYYKTGEIQSRNESAKYINRFDDSKSIFVGKATSYYKSGEKKEEGTHNSEGKLVGDLICYYESGKIQTKATFDLNGEIIGTFKYYYENGMLSHEFQYSNGAFNGKGVYYGENGKKTAEIEYENGNPKNKWYLAFDDSGNSYKYDIETSEPYVENKKSATVSYNLTLTAEGKLRNKGDVFGDIISYVPAGTTVGIYHKEKGYYKVNYSGKVGYLSELYFDKNMKTQNTNAAINSGQKEKKSYYKDGKTYQYYVHNGISVTMHLSIENNYGKYYVAYISIENLTGKSFNFNPNYIKAVFTKNEKYYTGEVLSSNEYMRKVNNRQAWNAALVAFGESYSANQAGYSSSSTTSTTSGYSNSYGSASGYYGNTYGSVYGSSSTYGSSTTRSTTQSYDGAANYAAQQNAQRNISNYQNQQYQIKSVLNQGYLKLNTLDNEQRMVGYVNVKYRSADKVKITIPVNGVNYDFLWYNK